MCVFAQFEPAERSVDEEKRASLAIISKLGDGTNRKTKSGDDVLNVRKAIRSASKGQGAAALGRQQDRPKRGKSRR